MINLHYFTTLSLLISIFQNVRSFTCSRRTTHFASLQMSPNTVGSFWDQEGLSDKYFQLDEREDKEESITEVLLKQNYAVEVGETDGPPPIESKGTWELIDGQFKMTIDRTFETGEGKKTGHESDMGVFAFTVKRTYTGTVSRIGERMSVDGIIHIIDDVLGDQEVGYFSLIDTTEDRIGSN